MRIALLHDAVSDDSRPDEVDGLQQAAEIAKALCLLGHEARIHPIGLDLAALVRELQQRRPDLVFNLVEALGGHGRLIHLVPATLEALRIPFTGCGSTAMFLTSNKLIAKRWLEGQGIPTPAWYEADRGAVARWTYPCTCIVKPVWEDASVGIDDAAVVQVAHDAVLGEILESASHRCGGEVFAEQFVEGRELNLSLLAGVDEPTVLPPAEIEFVGFPEGKPRIVGYAAKWREESFEYLATPRRFEFPATDQPLLERLGNLARRCWALFELRGYGRVDFRVDADGQPWVLEINANPCLSHDAGFMAAAKQAGLDPRQVVERIVADALKPPAGRVPGSHATNPAGL